MGDDEDRRRRSEQTERAEYHAQAQRRRAEEQSARAQVLLDRFVLKARDAGLPTEELTARPWSGRGRYRTGVVGWFLRRDRSIGVDTDGRFYVLTVAPVRLGRWRGVRLEASPPPLQAGKGARDGEAADLDVLIEERLQWSVSAGG